MAIRGDISKFLIQNKEDSIQLVKVDTFWTIAENDTLEIAQENKSRIDIIDASLSQNEIFKLIIEKVNDRLNT